MKLGNEENRLRLTDLSNYEEIITELGIKIVNVEMKGNCEDYVFREVKQEKWYLLGLRNRKNDDKFRRDSLNFLKGRGYCLVESAQNGDVVAYKNTNRKDVLHWGIWQRGKVRSKWGNCYVLEHEIDAVPIIYGDEAVFLRS